jgi:hypothetical protein
MSKSIPVLLSNLPVDTIPRTSFLQKGLLRTLREVSTGNFSKIYMPVDKARNCNIGSVCSIHYVELLLLNQFRVAVVGFASEDEARQSISALDGSRFGGEGRQLRMEKLDGSEMWKRLAGEGKVDMKAVERLECLEVVGWEGFL